MRITIIPFILLGCRTISVRGWSGDAHRVIADIASFNTELSTKNHLARLTGTSNDHELREWLKTESTWADDVDHLYPIRGRNPKYHFVHTTTTCGPYEAARDCGDKDDPDVCLVTGISNHIQVIVSPHQSDAVRQESLKYLIHFLADVHQPLHVGFRSDRGGNEIENVLPYNENLHNIWDNALVHEDMKTKNVQAWFGYGGYSSMIGKAINYSFKKSTREKLDTINFNDRAAVHDFIVSLVEQTSSELTCKLSYPLNDVTMVTTGASLDSDYIADGADAVSRQMRLAGVRLGKLLDVLVLQYSRNKAELDRLTAEREERRKADKEQRDILTAERRAAKKARDNEERAARKILQEEQNRERAEMALMEEENRLATRVRVAEKAELAAQRRQLAAIAAEASSLQKEWVKRRRESEKADRKQKRLVKKAEEAAAATPQQDEATIAEDEPTPTPTKKRVSPAKRTSATPQKESKSKSTVEVAKTTQGTNAASVGTSAAGVPVVRSAKVTAGLNRLKY